MQKHIHILGIGGTFMGGVAVLAKQLGFKVTGSDKGVYPPMSTMLENAGIQFFEGYDAQHFDSRPDLVVVGNAISRGNVALEYVLSQGIPYTSGPQWIAENVLAGKHVLAVSGTHGKTTVTSMLAWILTYAGLKPGFLIGGVANNFSNSAELGHSNYFVIESDEYDSAFFDKRSKFLHYRPRTLIMNNVEFDHGDIFDHLDDIKKQFSYLLRTVPANGLVIYPEEDQNVVDVLNRGCWSAVQSFGDKKAVWSADHSNHDDSQFDVYFNQALKGRVQWNVVGQHNKENALAAIAAAHHIGVKPEKAIAALREFAGVKRRLEVRHQKNGITIYDDFAHHPTAIAKTINALRRKVGGSNIVAVLQFGSNTMLRGMHDMQVIANSLKEADRVVILRPSYPEFPMNELLEKLTVSTEVFDGVNDIVEHLSKTLSPKDHVLIMTNKSFDNLHDRLAESL